MSEKENDSNPPSPDEISKKLSEFFKENFGGNVGFGSFPDMNTPQEGPEVFLLMLSIILWRKDSEDAHILIRSE